MGALMASQDVSNKLNHLEAQLSVHERLHVQSAETLREVKNVLVSNAKLSQQLVHVDKRLDHIDGRFDKVVVLLRRVCSKGVVKSNVTRTSNKTRLRLSI